MVKLNIVTIAPFCFPRSRLYDSVTARLHEQNFIFCFFVFVVFSWLLKMRDGELQTQKHKQKRENGSVANYQNSYLAPGLKGIKLVHEKVHETFDFPEIESVMILHFYLKASKKTVVSIRTRQNLLSGDLFSEKVGGRLPNKKGRRTG